jgi:hypothetical protein
MQNRKASTTEATIMPLLPPNEVESALSYAYVHAVTAAAGMDCQHTSRGLDNAGIDVAIAARDQFAHDSLLTDLSLHLQLKATSQAAVFNNGRFSFSLDVATYNRLRKTTVVPFRILVVFFMPELSHEWIQHTNDILSLKKCAYWVSLKGAPATQNATSVTIYLPQAQPFSPDGVTGLLTRLSRQEDVLYEP